MIQAQFDSLALTPDPIVLEDLPPIQVYFLHEVFHQIYKIHGVKMLPIDEDFDRRIDRAIEKLSLEEFRKRGNAFLQHLQKYVPNKYHLYFILLESLDPTGERRFRNNPGASPGLEIEKHKIKKTIAAPKKKGALGPNPVQAPTPCHKIPAIRDAGSDARPMAAWKSP